VGQRGGGADLRRDRSGDPPLPRGSAPRRPAGPDRHGPARRAGESRPHAARQHGGGRSTGRGEADARPRRQDLAPGPRSPRAASVVVTEGEPVADLPVPQVLVPSVRVSLARLAGAFYGHPSRQLALVGITGTNGKTTTSYLIEALLRARGLATGVIGTIQYV